MLIAQLLEATLGPDPQWGPAGSGCRAKSNWHRRKSAGNGISETLDFKISQGAYPQRFRAFGVPKYSWGPHKL